MGAIFSRSRKKSRITEVDRQILTLKLQRDQLTIFRRKLQAQYECAEESAKQLLRENKKATALLALKRRKEQESLLFQTDEHLYRVNQLISNVEVASIQAEVLKALEAANRALKSLQSVVSVDVVSRIAEESSELHGEVKEIGELLAVASAQDPDLVAEFERMEAAVAKESEFPLVPNYPLQESNARGVLADQVGGELLAEN